MTTGPMFFNKTDMHNRNIAVGVMVKTLVNVAAGQFLVAERLIFFLVNSGIQHPKTVRPSTFTNDFSSEAQCSILSMTNAASIGCGTFVFYTSCL